MQVLFLYFLIVFMAFCVILSRNPMQSILSLILVYLFTGCFFMMLGVEFLAILIFVLYVGAISILFLFVVMLLNLRIVELFNIFFSYFPVGSFLGLFFFFEIYFVFVGNFSKYYIMDSFFFVPSIFWYDVISQRSNLYFFGVILYDYNWFLVVIVSVVLFVAMLGSIIFTIDSFKVKNWGFGKFYFSFKNGIFVLNYY